MPDDADFLAHRRLVVQIAYDVTGSWVDAEDVAQQAYVRWRGVSAPVEHPRAYLARVATNLALDVVSRRDREGYAGPFLPEPVPTGPGADEAMVSAAEVEIALMIVLGTLSPLERAAFLLHDVFGFTHDEVAGMLSREPAAVRQLASRARRHVEARRPVEPAPDAAAVQALFDRFLAAARDGDVATLVAHLAEDAVFVGDGGGKRSTTRRPVVGAEKVARFLVGIAAQLDEDTRVEVVEANHRPALAVWLGGELDQVLWLVPCDGRVAQVLCVRNPDKLTTILRR